MEDKSPDGKRGFLFCESAFDLLCADLHALRSDQFTLNSSISNTKAALAGIEPFAFAP